MLPFNIQLKGVIVGVLAAWFLIPWIMGMFSRLGTRSQAAA